MAVLTLLMPAQRIKLLIFTLVAGMVTPIQLVLSLFLERTTHGEPVKLFRLCDREGLSHLHRLGLFLRYQVGITRVILSLRTAL